MMQKGMKAFPVGQCLSLAATRRDACECIELPLKLFHVSQDVNCTRHT